MRIWPLKNFRVAGAILALSIAAAAFPPAAAGGGPLGAAWLVEWDVEAGWREAAVLAPGLDTLQIFAAAFDDGDRPFLQPKLERWLDERRPELAAARAMLTVVNDIVRPGGGSVQKDTELIARLMASPQSRERHREALLELVERYDFSGLDIDYEKAAAEDWPTLLAFCRDLAADPRMRGKRVRVIVEPKAAYYNVPFPPELEYVVMAYNLFGYHSGPGPKADAPFVATLAERCRRTGAAFRLALSTGGFVWRADGTVAALTETRAAALAGEKKAAPRRDALSRYLVFSYKESDGSESTVWYADAETLISLFRTARDHGFEKFDLWRLGGNSPETLAALVRFFAPAGRELSVDPSDASAHPTLASALAAARPGDSIRLAPGEYAESVEMITPDLTIFGPENGDAKPAAAIVGDGVGPTLVDSHNTRWRGVAFRSRPGAGGVVLEGNSGRFEHCLFDASEGAPNDGGMVRIVGGGPVFHAGRFVGGAGSAMAATAPETAPGLADFTYCLFEGFAGDLVLADEGMNLRFANCLFTDNGLLVNRPARYRGAAEFVNCVFYFNRLPRITNVNPAAPPITVTNAVYTPFLNERIWVASDTLEKQAGVSVADSRIGTPRFVDSGRPLLLNYGIDDTVNTGVWEDLARVADLYGYKTTLAVITGGVTEDEWARMRATAGRGHEIASHTVSHVSIQPDPPLSLGFGGKGAKSASVTVVPGKSLVLRVDSRPVADIPLAAGVNVLEVAGRLRRAGALAVVSSYHGGAPAAFLEGVADLDVMFAKASVPLYLRNGEFVDYELGESRRALLERFPELEGELVFINPFGVNTPAAKKAMARIGYAAARSAVESGIAGAAETGDARADIDIFTLPSFSFQSIRRLIPDAPVHDNFLLLLDFLKRRFSYFSIYSHTYGELALADWEKALAATAADAKIEVVTLAEMARRIREEGEDRGGGLYSFTPKAASHDYRPAADSPLRGAGRGLGLPFDFAGRPVPPAGRPNIGLYQ